MAVLIRQTIKTIFWNVVLKRLNDVFVETAERIEKEEGEDYGWYDRDEHQFSCLKSTLELYSIPFPRRGGGH